MKTSKFSLLFFYVIYLAIFTTVKANIGRIDQVWHRRLKEARKAAKEAYKPNPMRVAAEFNTHVMRYIFALFNFSLIA